MHRAVNWYSTVANGGGSHRAAPGVSRRSLLAGAAATLALSACGLSTRPRPERVLFVGNSLIYRNDLPMQFAQVATLAVGHRVEAEMLARGGAHMSHHVAEGVVQRELATGRYSALVLQEFGGGLICHDGVEKLGFSCEASHAAHARLAALAGSRGVRTVLLGSYQNNRDRSLALAVKESELAVRIGALHVGFGDFRALLDSDPDAAWLDTEDGLHPGPDLTLLMALRIVLKLYGETPPPQPLTLRYRDYRDRQSPALTSLASAQNLGAPWRQRSLQATDMERYLRAAGARIAPSMPTR